MDDALTLDTATPGQPVPGAAVRLLPKLSGPEQAGTLVAWSMGPAGIMATADIAVDDDGPDLAGLAVWASIETSDPGMPAEGGTTPQDGTMAAPSLLVLEGVTAPLPGGGLTLTGALALATEPRRGALRASAPVSIEIAGEAAETVDLSRSGARISLPATALPASMRVALDLGDADVITTDAEVVRIDALRGEVALRFIGLTEADAVRIDRTVLSTLSDQR